MEPAHGGGASMILVGQGLATPLSVIVSQKVSSALSRRTPGTGGPPCYIPDDMAVGDTAASDPHPTAIRTEEALLTDIGQMAGQ
jgi:hypothetical protein